jgi:hypothetical protein
MWRRVNTLPARGSLVATFAILIGCGAPIGIAEDWRYLLVKIYNRTLTTISYEGGWVASCSDGLQDGLPPWPSPKSSPPPGSVPITFDLGLPADYKGPMSVIISATGVEVVRGFPNESDLPDCHGVPLG